MSTIQTVLGALPGIIAAALAFFSVLLTNKKNAETNAANRQLQLDIERIKATQFEFQTKFSLYHQKRAAAIESLYERLSELETVVSQLVSLNRSYEGRAYSSLKRSGRSFRHQNWTSTYGQSRCVIRM